MLMHDVNGNCVIKLIYGTGRVDRYTDYKEYVIVS